MPAAYRSHFTVGNLYSASLLLLIFVFALLFSLPGTSSAQNQIVTDHYNIYFSPHAKETARRVAEIAEEVYAPLTTAFNAFDELPRIHILVHDDVDFSNGFALYYQNKVEIWASDFDFELRGGHNWLKGVVTHELAHIVSMQVASRGFFNFGLLDFGQFNVNPDFSFTLPYLHIATPTWFVEGIAQFETYRIGHDDWDSHRDMLLRMAVLEDDLLSYDQMGVFAGSGLHREMVYNQGFALLKYILENYGEGKVEQLTRNTGIFSFSKAIKKVLGISPGKLYEKWKQDLQQHYGEQVTQIASRARTQRRPQFANLSSNWQPYLQNGSSHQPSVLTDDIVEGTLVIDGGYLDYHPAISPDGKTIAFISNEKSDFSGARLKIYDIETGEVEDLDIRANSRVSWTPDGKELVYVRRKTNFNDLFIYNIETQKERRISVNLRAKDPSVSPDGKTIAFVRNRDGSTNLGLIDIDGTDTRYFTNFNNGTQFYRPVWSPDGSQIAFSIYRGEDRDIATLRTDSPTFSRVSDAPDSLGFSDESVFKVLVNTDADERDPYWLPNGSGLIFSADYDGIFNLYEYTLADGKTVKRSAVIGGAFTSTVSPDGGTIIYAGYHAANYNIYSLSREAHNESVQLSQLHRDYQSIYTGKSLSDLYTIGRASKRFSIMQAAPIITFSPSAVGNRFTINSINAGMQFVVGDMLGSDTFVGTAIVGRAVDKNLDLNYTLAGYYERRLPSILTKDRTLAPTGYGFVTKSVINDFFDLTTSVKDTATGDITIVFSNGIVDTLRDVSIFLNQQVQGGDQNQFDFTTFGLGLRLPISSTQSLGFQFEHKGYEQKILRDAVFSDSSRFFLGQVPIPFGNLPFRQEVDAPILDTEFFSSNDISLSWEYTKLTPTVDALINPSGGRRLRLGYARLNTTITDSLVQILSFGLPGPTNLPARRDFPINQYSVFWQEFISLPFNRHTLGFESFAIYRDKRLPEFEELTNIDGFFPLRLYLGGQRTLRGYPYFTRNGSKLFFARLNYTFPIFQNIGKQFFHMYLDRLYGSLFFEGGTTWNFEKVSIDNLKATTMIYDVGAELRMSLFSFYRIPGAAYFQIAWPLTRIPDRNIDVGDQRIYFGIRLGGL